MKNQKIKKTAIFLLLFVSGLTLGWLLFGNKSDKNTTTQEVVGEHSEIWTCSMHPQIRQDAPGNCPICGMTLIPLENSGSNEPDLFVTQLSPSAVVLANIQTSVVEFAQPEKDILLQGIIEPDETRIATQSVHFDGRIEKLFISYEGQYVNRGQIIASIYSPELVTAQQEFIEAIQIKESNPLLYEAAKRKLKLLKVSDNQINNIEATGEIQENFNVLADVSGYVSELNVSAGDYVKAGEMLFKIIDLSRIWVVFDAYEKDLPFINVGDEVEYKVPALGDKTYDSKITFVSPVIDPVQRTVDIRTSLVNPNKNIKIGMFAQGIIKAKLNLSEPVLVVPKSAVLWTGKRSVVYVEKTDTQVPEYELRVVELGEELGNYFIINNGLSEGEKVVTNGAFSVDAAAQLAGNYSMMNLPDGDIDNEKNTQLEGVSEDFINQINEMLDIYIEMTDFLIAASPDKVAEKAEELRQIADRIDLSSLSSKDKIFWKENLQIIVQQTDNMVKMKGIDMQRSHYQKVSNAIIKLAKNFGHYNTTYYVQYCPMANDSKGAYWLSNIKQIKNPYFGNLMIDCGETKDSLQ